MLDIFFFSFPSEKKRKTPFLLIYLFCVLCHALQHYMCSTGIQKPSNCQKQIGQTAHAFNIQAKLELIGVQRPSLRIGIIRKGLSCLSQKWGLVYSNAADNGLVHSCCILNIRCDQQNLLMSANDDEAERANFHLSSKQLSINTLIPRRGCRQTTPCPIFHMQDLDSYQCYQPSIKRSDETLQT